MTIGAALLPATGLQLQGLTTLRAERRGAMPLQDGHGGDCEGGVRVRPLMSPITHRTHLGSINRLYIGRGDKVRGVARKVIILTCPPQIDGAARLPRGSFLPVKQQQMPGTLRIDGHTVLGYKDKTRLRTAPG